MGIGESDNGGGAPKDSFAASREAYQVLVNTMGRRLTEVHDQWKAEHGFQGLSWEEVDKRLEAEYPDGNYPIAAGAIVFEEQWQQGQLIGESEFMLESINPPEVFMDPHMSSPEVEKRFFDTSLEERNMSPYKTLRFSTRKHGREDKWIAFFLPDAPPFAVNVREATQLNFDPEDPAAVEAIKDERTGFGKDAVPNLTASDMQTLAVAVQHTPAKVSPLIP